LVLLRQSLQVLELRVLWAEFALVLVLNFVFELT
jgi:hypothetical protein